MKHKDCPDEERLSAAFNQAVRRHCDNGMADALLNRCITLIDGARRAGFLKDRTYFEEDYARLVTVREDSELSAKVQTILQMGLRLGETKEGYRVEKRGAEQTVHLLIRHIFKAAYRAISRHLNEWERRLFCLMYLSHPALTSHIPALDPVLQGFFTGNGA
jgi:hypothetical protein